MTPGDPAVRWGDGPVPLCKNKQGSKTSTIICVCILSYYVRYIICTIKFICIKGTIQGFSTFTEQCDCHHNLILEISITPKASASYNVFGMVCCVEASLEAFPASKLHCTKSFLGFLLPPRWSRRSSRAIERPLPLPHHLCALPSTFCMAMLLCQVTPFALFSSWCPRPHPHLPRGSHLLPALLLSSSPASASHPQPPAFSFMVKYI